MFSTLSKLKEKQNSGFTHVVIADKVIGIKGKGTTKMILSGQPVSFHRNEVRAKDSKFVKSREARYFCISYVIGVYESRLAMDEIAEWGN